MSTSSAGANLSWVDNGVLAWACVVVWMGVIFAFSAQAHSGELTEAYLGAFNVSVRKCAHMFEYAVLFTLIRRAIKLTKPLWIPHCSQIAFVCTALYAMTDEFHQSFVPGRSATITDVMVDSTGALIAWLLFRFVVPKVWKSGSSS